MLLLLLLISYSFVHCSFYEMSGSALHMLELYERVDKKVLNWILDLELFSTDRSQKEVQLTSSNISHIYDYLLVQQLHSIILIILIIR